MVNESPTLILATENDAEIIKESRSGGADLHAQGVVTSPSNDVTNDIIGSLIRKGNLQNEPLFSFDNFDQDQTAELKVEDPPVDTATEIHNDLLLKLREHLQNSDWF